MKSRPMLALTLLAINGLFAIPVTIRAADPPRERISIDDDWRFTRGDPEGAPNLSYLVKPGPLRGGGRGGSGYQGVTKGMDGTPLPGIWPYILPSGNELLKDPSAGPKRPDGNPAAGVAYIASDFNDTAWRQLDLPHDFGIEGPFISPGQRGSDGNTGRLPSFGVAWYRKHLSLPASDAGRQIYLDIDGAMAYSVVFLNGNLVGGRPYGYASYRLDLTPYVKPGADNVLAIRLDNPPNSSRWYPGGGIYRNVWLTKTNPIHVAQWGTYLTTPDVSAARATLALKITVDNNSKQDAAVSVSTAIIPLNADGTSITDGPPAAMIPAGTAQVPAGQSATISTAGEVPSPRLWSPKTPNRYLAVTTVTQNGAVVDQYQTPFGIRTITYSPDQGLLVNGEHVKINGVCDHHDLGALGSAINVRALQRQIEILQGMGCNAIRTSHNPPAPELLDLCDQMGMLVMDETFDTWRGSKLGANGNDYYLLFPDWHDIDTRMLVRRDRNHPSVILWSIGNEIGEQGAADGGEVAGEMTRVVHEEDPTRPTTAAENSVNPRSPFLTGIDAIGLNYQGSRSNQYPALHTAFPNRFLYGSETESTVSSRGEYTFPVAAGYGTVVGGRGRRGNGAGGAAAAPATAPAEGPPGEDVAHHQVSDYGLYYPTWAQSPDTEFAAEDREPYVAGEFVWTGFDYIGEPTPWGGGNDPSRSSYFGIIDLAGFPKDRYYQYQAHWRPDFPMAHILPHWNWPDRVGLVTPVHVFTSGDEAELFLNDKSLGRKKKGEFEYRIRWDDVVYAPGTLKVVAYKDGKEWATETVKTTGAASKLLLKPDRSTIAANGRDLSFVTLTIADADNLAVPRSMNPVHFSITGPGEIVATDNGDATDLVTFSSPDRKAFNGLALAIVRAKRGQPGTITITATSEGLTIGNATIEAK